MEELNNSNACLKSSALGLVSRHASTVNFQLTWVGSVSSAGPSELSTSPTAGALALSPAGAPTNSRHVLCARAHLPHPGLAELRVLLEARPEQVGVVADTVMPVVVVRVEVSRIRRRDEAKPLGAAHDAHPEACAHAVGVKTALGAGAADEDGGVPRHGA